MGDAAEADGPIVLVDRSGGLERRLETVLRSAGHDCAVVDSAGGCMRLVEREAVAGVVSELALPDLDGVELLRSIRVADPDLPFVLAPRDGSESIAGDAIAAGVSGYVPQSEGTETIASRVLGALRGGSTSHERESYRRYRELVEMAPAPINVFDETGETIWGNDAVLDLLGLDARDELIGRTIFEFVHPDDRELARRELEAVIHRKESIGPTAMKLLRPDGQVRRIRVSTATGRYRGTDVGQAVIVDVTKREELSRQLKVLDTWLRHNIRNEMNVVHGVAGDIHDGTVDDPAEAAASIRTHVEHLVEQADREREIVDLLVDPPALVSIDLPDAVRREVRSKRATYPHARIEIGREADVEVEAPPQLPGAIGELIENAVEHNGAGAPNVWIETERLDRGTVEIRVSDDGPGIPAVERDVLLLERPIDQLTHGFGLGLQFTYCLVNRCDGSIRFADNDPAGSVVTVTLPTEDTADRG